MERDEIKQKFESTIDEAVTGAGARLTPGVKNILSQLVFGAAWRLAELEEDQQEHDVDFGVAAYRKLIGQMVKAAKTLTMFPELNEHAWDLAAQQLGPEPPFYFK